MIMNKKRSISCSLRNRPFALSYCFLVVVWEWKEKWKDEEAEWKTPPPKSTESTSAISSITTVSAKYPFICFNVFRHEHRYTFIVNIFNNTFYLRTVTHLSNHMIVHILHGVILCITNTLSLCLPLAGCVSGWNSIILVLIHITSLPLPKYVFTLIIFHLFWKQYFPRVSGSDFFTMTKSVEWINAFCILFKERFTLELLKIALA